MSKDDPYADLYKPTVCVHCDKGMLMEDVAKFVPGLPDSGLCHDCYPEIDYDDLWIFYNVPNWIMWGYGGRVLYPFVLFKWEENDVPSWLWEHEMHHVRQIKRDGWWKFHIKYIYYLIKHGYKYNPYEVEARLVAGA